MKIFPLLLVLCVALFLSACGQEEPVATSKPAAPAVSKAAPAVTEAVGQAKVAAQQVAKQVAEQVTESAEQMAQQVTENAGQVVQQVEEKAQAAVAQVKDTLTSGQLIYARACFSCHKIGLMGAPIVGDKAVWTDLIAGGKEKLVSNAITGIGTMPAKGGVASLTDEEVAAAVDYMVEQSR